MPQLTSHSGRVISLRPPQPGDEQILYEYAQTLQNEDTYILLNPSSPVTLTEEQTHLADSLKKMAANWQIHYLAFCDGKMIGSSQVSKQGRRKMHVGNFGISLLSGYRHDGIGEQFSRIILEEAKTKLGIMLVTLECFSGNLVAQKLYQKLGFLEYGRVPNGLQYKDGYNDAIYMYKLLA